MFVRSMYPVLQREHFTQLMGMPEPERRQALVLLGSAYRSARTEVIRQGICSLAILVTLERLREHNQLADIDVLLEALLVALREGRDVEGSLYSVTANNCRSEARHRRKSTAAQESPEIFPRSSVPAPILTLPQAIALLPPAQQQIAHLLINGDQASEIALSLGISEKAAQKRIDRTREALRDIIF